MVHDAQGFRLILTGLQPGVIDNAEVATVSTVLLLPLRKALTKLSIHRIQKKPLKRFRVF